MAKSEQEQANERAEQVKRGEHKDLGQQQAETLNDADWNQQDEDRREARERTEKAQKDAATPSNAGD